MGGAAVALMIGAVLVGDRYGITLWDWIKLLVVPAVIAGGGIWFNAQQRERDKQIADARAQDEALQAYLDQMSQLLTHTEGPLKDTLARARTLTVLSRLDGVRKASVLRFLYESDLINKDRRVLGLNGADLSGVDFSAANILSDHMYQENMRLTDEWINPESPLYADLREAERRGTP